MIRCCDSPRGNIPKFVSKERGLIEVPKAEYFLEPNDLGA
jgi:hypothetical protein